MLLKKNFLQGRMNLDLDERTLPDGEYGPALNIEVINAEGGDVGVAETQLSNKQLTFLSLGNNVLTMGKFEDEPEGKIYWFILSDSGCYLFEWDNINQVVSTVLADTRPENAGRVLNLKKGYLITGIQKVISEDTGEDLLMWTDDNIEPCCVNIERAKSWGTNNFEAEDIYLMKKQPRFAPVVTPTYSSDESNFIEELFIAIGYRYKYRDGERSAISSYSNYSFNPKKFQLDFQTMENLGMVNNFNAIRIGIDTGPKQVTDIEIIGKHSNSNALYLITAFNKQMEGWGDSEEKSYVFSNNKVYDILAEKELFRTFDNVPRKAKALDLIENIPVLGNYLEGYNIEDANGNEIKMNYSLGLKSTDLTEDELEVNNAADKLLISIPSSIKLMKGNRISLDLDMSPLSSYSGSYSEIVEFILTDDFANASELANNSDFKFFIEEILTSRFLASYSFDITSEWNFDSSNNFSIQASTATSITLSRIILTYTNGTTPLQVAFTYTSATSVLYSGFQSFSSLKTNRDLEVGFVYQDLWTRKSTVLASVNNTLYVPQKFSINQNRILVDINHPPPYWADTYKLVVKTNPLQYYTIFVNLFYKDGLYRWIKLEGANKDKVKEGDVLVVKSDLGGPVSEPIKVKVLEITQKEKNFIFGGEAEGDELMEEEGLYMKLKPNGFDMNLTEASAMTFEGSSHRRYPPRTFTDPIFGKMAGSAFTPYSIGSGSTIRIFIEFKARGSISYTATYDKRFNATSAYPSIKDWFDAEVENLGQFGRDYTWDGIANIWDNTPPSSGEGYHNAGPNNEVSGWGFSADGSRFFVRPHRKGTSSRSITTTVRFEVMFTEGFVIFETEPKQAEDAKFYETQQTFEIINGQHRGNIQNQNTVTDTPAIVEMDFFNCYVQGGGVESYRVKDAINTNYLNIDLKPTAVSIERYREIRRFADLTYGEAFIESTNTNGLNVFNVSQANFKELDKQKGAIQALMSREGDLVVFQEGKVGYVLFGRDLLSMANGEVALATIPEILGSYNTYLGDNGIGKNPESIARDAYRAYYVNPRMGTPMRLSEDGTTEINYGTIAHFRNLFINNPDSVKLGGFDPYHNRFVLFSEDSDPAIMRVNCGNVINKSISEPFSYVLTLNDLLGDVTLGYSISGGNATVEAVFNGISNVASNVTGSGSITFERDVLFDDKVYVTVTPISESINIQITNTCPIGTPMKIISIVLGDTTDVGKTIINRFKRGNSQFYSDTQYFENEGINKFLIEDGLEGVGKFPVSGEQITIQSFKDTSSTAVFDSDKRNAILFLVSNVLYSSSQVNTILNLSTELAITKTDLGGGSEINSGQFNFVRPTPAHHLYMIWDYTNKNEPPVAVDDSVSLNKGASVDINVLSNDTDPDLDELMPIIVSNPMHGVVSINPDKTIKYTHDNSENFSDSFTYKVNDGYEDSNVATVDVSVGVDCSAGITANGSRGIYEAIIVVGSDTGLTGISYDAISVPDRFQIEFNGEIVADSKYVGSSIAGDPPTYPGLIAEHADLPVFAFNGLSFDNTLETRNITVAQPDIIPVETGLGAGVLIFNKLTKNPTTVKIIVTAPLGGTAWNISGICPGYIPE